MTLEGTQNMAGELAGEDVEGQLIAPQWIEFISSHSSMVISISIINAQEGGDRGNSKEALA